MKIIQVLALLAVFCISGSAKAQDASFEKHVCRFREIDSSSTNLEGRFLGQIYENEQGQRFTQKDNQAPESFGTHSDEHRKNLGGLGPRASDEMISSEDVHFDITQMPEIWDVRLPSPEGSFSPVLFLHASGSFCDKLINESEKSVKDRLAQDIRFIARASK
jgi:hypothetical protein